MTAKPIWRENDYDSRRASYHRLLRERLPNERKASPHTSATYAYAFQLLFQFASQRLGCSPAALQLEQLDAPLVLAFLEHLQADRRNGPSTRNARLAAIKSFMHFLEYRVPSALEQLRQVLAIPFQKTDTRLVRHSRKLKCKPYSMFPIRALVMASAIAPCFTWRSPVVFGFPNSRTQTQRCDVSGGLCRSPRDGKGRKECVLTLWKTVAGSLRAWLSIRGDASVPELFLNARAQPLTRSGFKHIVNKHFPAAVNKCPSLKTKRVSPHVLRHTSP